MARRGGQTGNKRERERAKRRKRERKEERRREVKERQARGEEPGIPGEPGEPGEEPPEGAPQEGESPSPELQDAPAEGRVNSEPDSTEEKDPPGA